ncbi:MAG: hypothetical protein Q7V31_03560 [Parvibaculum sp.]|uniref:hypothetical protein n=1 Tax=Parvibaculum sp. TaxID=2024848 RepID=UPI0027230D1D|nr:hypothetical protein [Parvibaculum sp.]MDO8837979.1 hypothetical protein [Parvibaculum sp.]
MQGEITALRDALVACMAVMDAASPGLAERMAHMIELRLTDLPPQFEKVRYAETTRSLAAALRSLRGGRAPL